MDRDSAKAGARIAAVPSNGHDSPRTEEGVVRRRKSLDPRELQYHGWTKFKNKTVRLSRWSQAVHR